MKPHSPLDPALNAVVMASAGTGKTWQLVTRLLRLLLTGAPPDALLAITFTRKAAREMETRLLQRLYQLARADDAELLQLLREADAPIEAETTIRASRLYEQLLRAPGTLRTTTFHAFCQEMLRRFPLEADVPPGFELSETTGEVMDSAWQALLNEVAVEPDGALAHDLEQLLALSGEMASLRGALESFVAHRGDWWAYIEDEEDGIAFAVERLRLQLAIEPQADPLERLFTQPLEAALAEFVALLALHATKEHERQLAEIADARDTAQPHPARFAALQSALLTQAGAPRSRKPSKAQAKSMGGEAEEGRFLELAEVLLQRTLHTQQELAAIESWRFNTLWYRVGAELLRHFQRIKEEQRLLDFTDLEWRAYRLLTREESAQWVQYKLDQRIDHLLVDEFQDTNPTQWRLLLPLLQEMAAGDPERRRSVFLVGDTKQSIYRFRRAEPRLFAAATEWLASHMAAHTFPLHSSRRSGPAITEAVNQIFTSPGGSVLYDFSPHTTHLETVWSRVTVLPQPPAVDVAAGEQTSALRNPLLQPRQSSEEPGALLEARQVAGEIKRLVAQGTVIGPAHQARPLHYGDIMLLIRKRTRVAYFETALREAGIPFIGADRGTLLESLEVRDMIALLQELITPYDNLALATVLRSPLFSCSSAELATLALQRGASWWERLAHLDTPSPTLQRAATLLHQWHTLAGQIPNHDLLDRIYNEGNVLERYEAAYPDHLRPRVRANLIRFLELALEVDSGRYPSLNHFLAHLEQLRERMQEAPDESPPAGGERVRLMTIHAAKGLESPVVFLVDSDSGEGRDRATLNALVNWPAEEARPANLLLVGRKAERDPLTRQLLEAESAQAQRESANLLYVALTRARQLLYISGSQQSRNGGESWYRQVRSALDPLESVGAELPRVMERGTMPAMPATSPDSQAIATPVQLPPGLSHPAAPVSPYREIAPSRTATNATMAGSGDEDGLLRGMAIHRFIQLLLTAELAPAARLSHVGAELGIAATDPSLKEYYREAEQVVNHPPFAHLFTITGTSLGYCEVPLLYTLDDGAAVHGIIDRLVVTDDEILLVDYKSHRSASAATIPQLAEQYREQMRHYSRGIGRLWPGRTLRPLLLFTAPLILHEVAL